jgi:16S rRNA (uracil1498-N3)-methyltransferase
MVTSKRRIPRLFVDRDLVGESLGLDEREAHYLGNVLRLKRGDELVAFNGRGTERAAMVATLRRHGAELELRSTLRALPPSRLELTIIQALPKADAMDLVVQKSTELGVGAILPVYTELSVVKLDAERTERRLEHWRRIAQGACEQCGRHEPPRIAAPMPLGACLESLRVEAARFALDPDAERRLEPRAERPARVIAAIGPEGGFAVDDWRRLDGAAFGRISLGPRVLRVETATLSLCAVVQSLWGDM